MCPGEGLFQSVLLRDCWISFMHFNTFHQSGKLFGHYAFQCFLPVLLCPLFLGLLLTCMLNTFIHALGQSSGALFLYFHSFLFLFFRWDISVDFRFVIPIFASSNPILNTSTGFFICIVLLFNAKISISSLNIFYIAELKSNAQASSRNFCWLPFPSRGHTFFFLCMSHHLCWKLEILCNWETLGTRCSPISGIYCCSSLFSDFPEIIL